MTIATEIQQLKELADSGVISADEFESAKRKLLGLTAKASITHFPKEHLIGKWRLVKTNAHEGEATEITLMPNGKVKMKSEIPSLVETNFGKAMSLATNILNAEGKWWLDGNTLTMAVKRGNIINQYFSKENATQTSIMKIISIDSNAIQAENASGNAFQFFRIGIQS